MLRALFTNQLELVRGFRTQARVVSALALRETRTRFGAYQLGYLWALAEPLIFILTFWILFSVAGRTTPFGSEIIPFLATGIIPYQLAVSTAERVALSVESNKGLLFYPHVQPLDLILARGGLEIATFATVFVLILGGYALFTGTFEVHDPALVMLGLALGGLLGIGLGTILCAARVVYNVVDRIRGPIMRPLFWISGCFFAVNALPSQYRRPLMLNPLLHCVELVRDGWFPAYQARHVDVVYVLYWIVGMLFVGLTMERAVRRRIEVT